MNARATELLKDLARLQSETEQVRREAKRTGRTNVEIYAKGAEGAYADAMARVSIALPTIIAEACEDTVEAAVSTWTPGELTEAFGK